MKKVNVETLGACLVVVSLFCLMLLVGFKLRADKFDMNGYSYVLAGVMENKNTDGKVLYIPIYTRIQK